jgi:hypothetical protein
VSKYPVKYLSSSKGEVEIESMATPHLLNAWRKVRKEMLDEDRMDCPHYKAMTEELTSRGGNYEGLPVDKWTMPPRDAEVESREGLVQ